MRWGPLLACAVGCVDAGVFPCSEDTQCGPNGNCEPTGYCSFPDPACGGRRYGGLAPAGLSGQCVIEPGGYDGGGRTPDAAPPPDGRAVADAGGTDAEVIDIVCDLVSPCPFLICPAGATCRIDCQSVASCPLGIDCSEAAACEIQCQGQSSCQGPIVCTGACDITCAGGLSCPDLVTCGPGPCNVTCQGPDSCAGTVDCSGSCACTTACSPGACLDLMCPLGCREAGQCTALGEGCDGC